jgi:hypothetical protein
MCGILKTPIPANAGGIKNFGGSLFFLLLQPPQQHKMSK